MLFRSSICQHQRERSRCKECGGARICQHQRVRSQCKECGGASICQHQCQRSTCKECGGASICQHQRQWSQCKECGGASICQHGLLRLNSFLAPFFKRKCSWLSLLSPRKSGKRSSSTTCACVAYCLLIVSCADSTLFDPAFAPAEGAFLEVAAEAGKEKGVVEAALLLGLAFPVDDEDDEEDEGKTRVFDCNQPDRNGQTGLHRVAQQGCPALLFALLISAGANVNAKDEDEVTPLWISAYRGPKDTVLARLPMPKTRTSGRLFAQLEAGRTRSHFFRLRPRRGTRTRCLRCWRRVRLWTPKTSPAALHWTWRSTSSTPRWPPFCAPQALASKEGQVSRWV